jgi:hypothetical protein
MVLDKVLQLIMSIKDVSIGYYNLKPLIIIVKIILPLNNIV